MLSVRSLLDYRTVADLAGVEVLAQHLRRLDGAVHVVTQCARHILLRMHGLLPIGGCHLRAMALQADIVLLRVGQIAEPDNRLAVRGRVLASRTMTRLAPLLCALLRRIEEPLAVRQFRPSLRILDVTRQAELAADVIRRSPCRFLRRTRLLARGKYRDADNQHSAERNYDKSMILHGIDNRTFSHGT